MNVRSAGPHREPTVDRADRPYDVVVEAPFGALGVCVGAEVVEQIALLPGITAYRRPTSAFAEQVAEALQHYFRDPRYPFALPLRPRGSPFRQRVWQAMREVPPGQTRSYGELARRLGSSARAVGGACGANPIAVVVPCHRVVAANGLGGFSGQTDGEWLAVKRWLLHHEGVPGIELSVEP